MLHRLKTWITARVEKFQLKEDAWLWRYALAICCFAFAVNVMMYIRIPTPEGLHASDWLSFWGSYLGGALGCVAAIAALRHSQKEAKRQHEEVQEQLEESRRQAKQQHEESEEDRHLSVRPFITANFRPLREAPASFDKYMFYTIFDSPLQQFIFDNSGIKDRFTDAAIRHYHNQTIELTLENVGLGPALDIELVTEYGNLCFGSLGAGKSVCCAIILPHVYPQNKDTICKLQYADIFFDLRAYEKSFTYSETNFIDGQLKPLVLVKQG